MPLRLTIRSTAAAPGGVADVAGVAGGTTAELVFDRDAVVLGRAAAADVRLPGAAVSLRHARLERVGPDWFAQDGGSTNGTRLNGGRLQPGQRRILRSGDTLEVPGFVLDVTLAEEGPPSGPAATQEVARRMVREVLQALGGDDAHTPSLRVTGGPQAGARLLLAELERTYVIGRAATCDLRLDDRDASREHATVRRDVAGVTITDLDAKNGVTMGGLRLTAPRQLVDGDELVVGATRLRFVDPAEAWLRELEAQPDASPPAPDSGEAMVAAPAPAAAAAAPEAAATPAPAAAPGRAAAPAPGRRPRRGPLLLVLFAVAVACGATAALWLLVRS